VIVISHRGYWKTAVEKNRPIAFQRSFDFGFGAETDVRDRNGALVIAHDPPDDTAITLESILDMLGGRDLPLAINVKADGLGRMLMFAMRARGLRQWFTFDMTVPELVAQIRLGLPVYTRASEYERSPPCYDQAAGVWLDAFHGPWYTGAIVRQFLNDRKAVSIVSPELHGRDHLPLWAMLRAEGVYSHPSLMICTDLPEDARAFFGSMR